MNRLKYIDTFAWGTAHEVFNACLLQMCASSSATPLSCRCSKSSFSAIERVLEKESLAAKIDFKPLPILPGNSKYRLLFRYILGSVLIWFYLLFSRKDETLIIPFNNVFAISGINFINKFAKRRIIIFCHGEMEALVSTNNVSGILSKLLYRLCRSFFFNKRKDISKGLYFSVLGDKVRSNIQVILPPQFQDRLLSIDHPYMFGSCNTVKEPSDIVRLATCGGMSYSKGASMYADFAEKMLRNIRSVEIIHIGTVLHATQQLLDAGIKVPSESSALDRAEYNSLIAGADYLLYFYNKNSYKVTASGAIMDAIAFEKPIIAIRNDYFEYIFDKFGAVGFLCDSVDDMVITANQIIDGSLQPIFNFSKIKSKFTPRAIEVGLSEIIADINR